MIKKQIKKMGVSLFLLLCIVFYFGFFGVSSLSAAKISLNSTNIKLNINDEYVISLQGTDTRPSYASTNVNVATVSADGTVKAVGKGSANINVRVGTTTLKCKVTVVSPTIKLSAAETVLYVGGTSKSSVLLRCTASGAAKTVSWSSDNAGVATVDTKGNITAHAPGSANITATANGISASCRVCVKETKIELSESNVTIGSKGVGSSATVKANVTGTSKTVRWSSANTKIATVSGGRIVARGIGSTVITATANGVSSTINVTVRDGLSVDAQKITLYTDIKDSYQLKTNAAGGVSVNWISLNESVATVSNGKVIPVSEGETYIKAYASGSEATTLVTVKKTNLTIKETNVELKNKYDNVYNLSYDVVAKNPSVKWTSSAPSVATVKNGVITARAVGNAFITGEVNGIKRNVNVRVRYFTPSISLNYDKYTLYSDVKDTVTLKATVDGPAATVTWSSDNCNIVQVVNGKLTTIGEGTTTVRAKANGAVATCTVTVLPTKVELSTDYISLDKGETSALAADISGKNLSYTLRSQNARVATVSATGVVKAVGYGETDIVVTSNGIVKKCHVSVSPCEHEFGPSYVKTDSSCLYEGTKESVCRLCGQTKTESIPKKPHENGTPVRENIDEPTCTKMGSYEEVIRCKNCPRELSRQKKIIDKTPHSESSEYFTLKEKSCYEDGLLAKKCINCGEILSTVSTGRIDHHYEWKTKSEKTEVDNGYESEICTGCGLERNRRMICAHLYREMITDDYGNFWVKCNDCGSIINENYPKPENREQCKHLGGTYLADFGSLGVWACCRDCTACLRRYDVLSDCSHDGWFKKVERVVRRATESESGIVEIVCTNCGQVAETVTIHPYKEYIVDLGNGNTGVVYGYFDNNGYREEIMDMVNQLRANNRKCSLSYADYLQADCDRRAVECAYSFSHVRPNNEPWHTIASLPVNGENLGKRYWSPEEVMKGWTDSTGHRQNMLTDWFRTITASCFHQMEFKEGSYVPNECLIWVQWFGAYDAYDLGLESEDEDYRRYEGIFQTDENYIDFLYLLEDDEDSEVSDENAFENEDDDMINPNPEKDDDRTQTETVDDRENEKPETKVEKENEKPETTVVKADDDTKPESAVEKADDDTKPEFAVEKADDGIVNDIVAEIED